MTDDPKSGAVLFGKDLSSLARFYEGVAGLSVVLCESDVVILESAQQQLVLHGVPAAVARTIEIATPPRLRKDTAVKLVFAVESIDAARVAAVTLGGRVNDKKHAFEVRGFRACDGHDPEGNIIQLRECLR